MALSRLTAEIHGLTALALEMRLSGPVEALKGQAMEAMPQEVQEARSRALSAAGTADQVAAVMAPNILAAAGLVDTLPQAGMVATQALKELVAPAAAAAAVLANLLAAVLAYLGLGLTALRAVAAA